jgi:WD40 repeat protein
MTTNPFPGPQPYRAADRDRFFGRADMAHKLRGSILASRCVTVHGPSGAGKSSLMQAAVLPTLAEKNDARLIRVDSWPEGEEPTKWLAAAMHAEFGLGDLPTDELAKEAVFRTARGAARASSRPLVIYLDQLEQLLFMGRTVEETQPFFDCLEELVDMPLRTVRVVLSLREDYLGRFRDRLRDLRRVTEGGFRVGPLNVAELTDAVVQAAAAGNPAQEWSIDEMHGLMLQVRMPGQAASDEAEAQSAYAQIICRALFQERAAGKTIDVTEAEPILLGYLESTVADLGPLRAKAELLLEDHLVGADGSRTLRTEKELGRVIAPLELSVILRQLESAAILRAEEHHGSRYFEIGHDWLARRVFEQRDAREKAKALEHEREEARVRLEAARKQRRVAATIAGVSIAIATGAAALGLWALAQQKRAEMASEVAKFAENAAKVAETDAKAKAVEASDARLMAGFRELRNRGDVAAGIKLLHEVQKPNEARGWLLLANDALQNAALEVTLRGAQTPFSNAAWSPDGTRIAAGSEDGKVWTWKTTGEGDPVAMPIHDKRIVSIAWSPNGKRLLTASEDGTARLFDSTGKDKPVVFDPKVGPLRDAKFTPDGERFAVLATDIIARVWQTDGSGPLEIKGHTGELTSMAFMPDGQSLVTTSADKTARITALDGSGKAVVLRGHKDAVRFAASSPNGSFVVTTSDDKTAIVWPASGKGAPVVLEGHTDAVVFAAWSPDGTHIATASLDKTARNWSSDGKSEAVVFSAEGLSMASVAFRNDGRYLLTKSFDHSMAVWPSSGGKPFSIEAHDGPVATAAWSFDGKRVLSAAGVPTSGSARDRTVKVWRLEHMESLARTRKPFFHAASILPSGDRAIAAFDDRSAQLFRLDGEGESIHFSGHEGWVTNAFVSPNGSSILTTSLDKTARVWNADGKGEAIVLRGADGIVRAGAISPDGQRVVTGSDDKKARLWKVAGGALERELSGHTDLVTSVAWSPNGEWVATTSMDQSARIWRADGSGTPIELKGHRGGVVAAAWSPDGSRIVTASEDFTAQVWNTATGQSLFSLDHDGGVLAVAWSADGKRIATSSIKNGLRVWNADGSEESIEFPVESPILAMVFIDEGRQIVTISEDDTTRTFTIDVATLMRQLETANRDCLPMQQRVTYLGETLDVAETRHAACERLAKGTTVVVKGQ